MKKLIFIAFVFAWTLTMFSAFPILSGCSAPERDYKSEYNKLIETIGTVKTQQDSLEAYIVILQDSINTLNGGVLMTKEQHNQIRKFEQLKKFYSICKKNPSQWKYYRGWSTRVFEQ